MQNMYMFNYKKGDKVKVRLESISSARGKKGVIEAGPKNAHGFYKVKIDSENMTLYYILFENELDPVEDEELEVMNAGSENV